MIGPGAQQMLRPGPFPDHGFPFQSALIRWSLSEEDSWHVRLKRNGRAISRAAAAASRLAAAVTTAIILLPRAVRTAPAPTPQSCWAQRTRDALPWRYRTRSRTPAAR